MMNRVASTSMHPLVTQPLVETNKYYCPYLERGYCRESSRCNFSHDSHKSIRIPIDYCHFFLANQCLYGQDCKFRHNEPDEESDSTSSFGDDYDSNGLICDLCYRPCLNPFDESQRRQHRDDCLHEHEREMELSFAVQRSRDKVCGICMDTVVEKKPITSCRFGILEKCNHIFCLDCIRKWRGTKQFDNKTIRACPECRVSSDFVVPSKYWVEDQDDKDKLIQDYKAALRSKPCRYFNQGKGECPFAGSCFYKHAYPDGRLAVMEAPKPRRRHFSSRFPTPSFVANYIMEQMWNRLTFRTGRDADLWEDDDDDDDDDYDDYDYDYDYDDDDDPESLIYHTDDEVDDFEIM